MIKLAKTEWYDIKRSIQQEYPPSVTLMRSVMRRELGFTVRLQAAPSPDPFVDSTVICLDFYDEALEIIFRLKYL